MSFLADLKSKFLDDENYYLAFKKLKYYFEQGNEWFNPVELAAYEGNLATNLANLKQKVEDGLYYPSKMEILPFPKKNKGSEHRIRQYFRISIEDQLVWIVIANTIGRFCEKEMPFWSYGNRLFRPIWIDEESNKKEIIKGSFSSTSSNFYRKWNQSWPFYRRHISMTVKIMGLNSSFEPENLDNELEKKIYNQECALSGEEYLYLNNNFWNANKNDQLYWCVLDFENFFPSIKSNKVLQNIEKVLVRDDGTPRDDIELIVGTVKKMLNFSYDVDEWSLEELNLIGLDKSGIIENIPTGLLVSGFLANIAMIGIDEKITTYIHRKRNVAIFKYVDDQTVLSTSKESLLDFLNFYQSLLVDDGNSIKFQRDKIAPADSLNFSIDEGFSFNDDTSSLCLDIEFPEPLMTQTLEKMSNLNDEDYDLLSNEDLEKITNDLKHFLLADFPDSEMKRDTRVAFSATKLCQIGKRVTPNFSILDNSMSKNLLHNEHLFNIEEKKLIDQNETLKTKKSSKELEEIIKKNKKEYINKNFKENLNKELKRVNAQHHEIFKLLVRSAKNSPDKLKLWKRCAEYCFNTGYNGIKIIFEILDDVDIHKLGKLYIESYLMQCISTLLTESSNIIHNESTSFWDLRTSLRFISSISSKTNFSIERNFYFANETLENYNIIVDFVDLPEEKLATALIENQPPKNRLFKLESFTNTIYSHNQYWWLFLNKFYCSRKIDYWEKEIINIDLADNLSWSILLFFLNKIPSHLINSFKKSSNTKEDFCIEKSHFLNDGSGILYDIFKNREDIEIDLLDYYPMIKHSLSSTLENVSLYEWLNIAKLSKSHIGWVNPKLSEWTQLEIVKQIASLINEEKKKTTNNKFTRKYLNYYLKVHPANYLIPKQWLNDEKINWKKWKRIATRHRIKIKNSEELIRDHRYLPLTQYWLMNHALSFMGKGEFASIISLSVLLVKLLSKSFDWPPISNKTAFIDQVFQQSLKTLEQFPVSSDTRMLLTIVFSKRDIDFYANHESFVFEDGSKVENLEGFIKKINRIQIKLTKHQLDLSDQMPRQLTLINIDTLNKTKNIF